MGAAARMRRAAAAMASVRSAIQYAAQTDAPEVFLPQLSGLRSLRDQGMLATVLCVVIDLHEQRIRVTSAGHLPPLLVEDGRSQFLQSEVGLPIGVDTNAAYVSTSFPVPDGAYLFAFTDGLIERHDHRRFEVVGYSYGTDDASMLSCQLF